MNPTTTATTPTVGTPWTDTYSGNLVFIEHVSPRDNECSCWRHDALVYFHHDGNTDVDFTTLRAFTDRYQPA